jgi:hypothetical protein
MIIIRGMCKKVPLAMDFEAKKYLPVITKGGMNGAFIAPQILDVGPWLPLLHQPLERGAAVSQLSGAGL